MSEIGDTIQGKFPTHGVAWSVEHGWHMAQHDAMRLRTGECKATPATEGRIVELHPDGSATVEVAGPYHHNGPVSYYEPAERVRVPPLERAERHVENAPNPAAGFFGRFQTGPHWLP